MTTTTLPDTTTDVDLEGWLAGEIEKPCQILTMLYWACGRPAEWLLSVRPSCSCGVYTQQYVCGPCKIQGEQGGICCPRCLRHIEITWRERIK